MSAVNSVNRKQGLSTQKLHNSGLAPTLTYLKHIANKWRCQNVSVDGGFHHRWDSTTREECFSDGQRQVKRNCGGERLTLQ